MTGAGLLFLFQSSAGFNLVITPCRTVRNFVLYGKSGAKTRPAGPDAVVSTRQLRQETT